MFLSADLINLVLYCVQRLGVTLAVGAETILLVAYISAIRDGVIDAKEAQFSRAVRGVLNWGLGFIIVSGIGITIFHVIAGQGDIIFTPAYLFKWALIVASLVFTLSARYTPQSILEGVAGATWYALFLVHILAPVTTWSNLLTLYVVWLVGFVLCWWALVLLYTGKKQEPQKKIEAITSTLPPKFTPPPPALKPAFIPPPVKPVAPVATPPANLPVITQAQVAAQKPPEVKITDPDKNPGLPAISVMAKTPQDLENQNRASTVKFD